MAERLVVKPARGKHGYFIETESGEAIALTYRAGREGRRWATALVGAYNEKMSDSEMGEKQ